MSVGRQSAGTDCLFRNSH